MHSWRNIGPEWKTEDTLRVREILKGEHIPFKMPFTDVFFVNTFRLPSEEKRWSVMVRVRDWEKVVRLLIGEGLISGAELEACAFEIEPEPEGTVCFCAPVPSR
ncbi:MAG: hypothetical protein IKZ98_03495 [Clostridia bacterium]|nr:hypothetical protein [Clostridia bacterium]